MRLSKNLKTFKEAGYLVELLATFGREAHRNLIFPAAAEKKNFDAINYSEPNSKPIPKLEDDFLDQSIIDMRDALVINENQPVLKNLYPGSFGLAARLNLL